MFYFYQRFNYQRFFHLSLYTLFILYLVAFLSNHILAQTGTLKGQIIDSTAKESMIGVTVFLEQNKLGAVTDVDGNFNIENIPQGEHIVTISFTGYSTKKITNVKIEDGKITTLNIGLREDVGSVGEVVVTAERETGSELSLISAIKASEQVAVGVSSEQIAKSQDRDASQVIRRLPGVSLIENRFVMVRGLSQRYNAVMVNDMLTPSSEVDIKAFSFDVVPSGIIDRLLIYKSGAGELPGEFAGGVIKIYTKTAPEENFTNLSLNLGTRIGTTFNNALSIKGSNTDFLGFDNGYRQLPSSFPTKLGDNLNSEQRANLAKQLPNNWLAQNININPDIRLGFNTGRRFKIGGVKIGTVTSVNYSNTNLYTPEVKLNNYGSYDPTTQQTQIQGTNDDKIFSNTTRLGVLHNWWVKLDENNTLEFKNLFNQMGFSETIQRNSKRFDNGTEANNYSYRYEQRSIYTGQLIGKHNLDNGKFSINWVLGFSYTNRKEPDWRRFSTIRNLGTNDPFVFAIPGSPNAFQASRFYSNLNENVFTNALNFEYKAGKKDTQNPVKIRFGTYIERKDRTFNARVFSYLNSPNINTTEASTIKALPFDQIFAPENINGTTRFTLGEDLSPDYKYSANNMLIAGYLSTYIPITPKFSATVGIRIEQNTQEIQSRTRGDQKINISNSVLSALPSLNMTYNLNDKSLIRGAYYASLNRPEFRELAPFNFYDFSLNANFIGNPNLKVVNIHNVDVRYEYYPTPSELISVGAFYKNFQNPIETFQLIGSGGAESFNYVFGNAKDATSYGVEAEIRKSFAGISDSKFFNDLTFVGNVSFIASQINLGENVNLGADAGGIVNVGANQPTNRPMMNQSPYLINAGLYYNDVEKGWQVNILYNVFGKRIFSVGNAFNPNIFEMPRHVIDLNLTKTINKKIDIRFGIQDLLNQPVRLAQDNDSDGKITSKDGDFRTFKRGTAFNIGLNYNF